MRLIFTRGATFAALSITVGAVPAMATVTVYGSGGNGGIQLGTSSAATAAGQTDQHQTYPAAFYTVPTTSYSIQSAAQDASAGYTAAASNALTVTFAGAAAGILTNVGRASASGSATASTSNTATAANYIFFRYAFTTDVATTLDLIYSFSGPKLGCCGNSIQVQDLTGGGNLYYRTIYNSDLTGGTTVNLLASHSYLLSLSKGEYQSYDAPYVQGNMSQSDSHSDSFTFSIGGATLPTAASPAPEPAAWATMVAGFGFLGAAVRRGRRRAIRAGGAAFA